jgi:hypothetical protein
MTVTFRTSPDKLKFEQYGGAAHYQDLDSILRLSNSSSRIGFGFVCRSNVFGAHFPTDDVSSLVRLYARSI